MEIYEMTAGVLAGKIRDKEVSVPEAVDSILARIHEKDKEYNCYITVCDDRARADAQRIQDKITAGELSGPLAGVPVAVKDNMCTEGILTSCASRILSNFVPVYSSDAVLRLQAAGAVVIGKTNMDEFAMGSTTETSWYGPTKKSRRCDQSARRFFGRFGGGSGCP